MRTGKLIVVGVAAVALLSGAYYLYRSATGGRQAASPWRLHPLSRGTLVSSVATTGTLNAVTTVQVGTQVSGRIQQLLADYNSPVARDQVIAVIDPDDFRTRVAQAEADLAVSQANVAIQEANVERARTDLDNAAAAVAAAEALVQKAAVALADARRDLERKRALFAKQVIAASLLDAAQAAHDQAAAQLDSLRAQAQAASAAVAARRAALKMAEAQVAHARAQVAQRQAALASAQVDLDHTVIRSPVDGVVIERSVDVGQTVAASLQAPRLFLIAQDLRRMQVEADVDEADIGRVQVGQRAVFGVDAYAERRFAGRVLQIRKAPHTVQNVVTYTVVISADNDDLRLLPGMTADVEIVIEERRDVLKVPNAALRFRPSGSSEVAGPADGVAAGGDFRERIQRLAAFLELDEAQQASLREALADTRRQVAQLRGQGTEAGQVRELVERQRENLRRRLEALLTPAQREKYARFVQAREGGGPTRGRLWVLDDEGRPKPVEVTLGISDGEYTELLEGGLAEGDQVLVGQAAPPADGAGSRSRGGK